MAVLGSNKLLPRIYFYYLLAFSILQIKAASSSCSTRAIDGLCTSNNNCSTGTAGFMNQVGDGVQLLIPVTFTCQGTITEWRAHIDGNATSLDNLIEFQIYEPVPDTNGTYSLVYGNPFNSSIGGTQNGSLITRPVSSINPQYIPIMPGNIVGVYLPPSTSTEHILSLLYTESSSNDTVQGDDTVYYWTNVQNRMCGYSLCTANVLRNVHLLLEWDYIQNPVSTLKTIVDQLKDNDPTGYCMEDPSIQECITALPATIMATPTSTVSIATGIKTSSPTSTASMTTGIKKTSSTNSLSQSSRPQYNSTVTTMMITSGTLITTSALQHQHSFITSTSDQVSSPSVHYSTNTTIVSNITSSTHSTTPTSTILTNSAPSTTTSVIPGDDSSTPSSTIGGLSNSLLTLFGTVLVLLFVIIILILILILIFVVTSKRKKTYPIESHSHHQSPSDKMELELVLEDEKKSTNTNTTPNHHNYTSSNKNGGPPITNISVKQQLDEDYSEIEDNFQESSRKDYKPLTVVTSGPEYCEPNIVFNSKGEQVKAGGTTDKDVFAVYESMYDDYDIPNNNRLLKK